MQRIVHPNTVVTYTFDSLAALPLAAHVSTRHGGVSPDPWRSLNFSVLRGDDPQRVRANRQLLAEAAGVQADTFVGCRQMHGTGVAKVDWSDAGTFKDNCDALVTDAPALPLFLVFADCVPVLLYDPHHHALGLCHAGWRGTVNGAATAALWALQAAYDSDPSALIACIGPSIGPQSYAVGDEVLALAYAKLPNAEQLLHYPDGPDGQPHFDLWEANRSQLMAAGVRPEHIEVAGIDTATHTDDFFSHRAEHGRCGLFGMLAWLAPLPGGDPL
jgi:YfiH family protein